VTGATTSVTPARRAARSWELLAALVASDLRARYGRGRFRMLKWLLDPFALVGVYLLLVTFVLDRPGRAPGVSLACAVIPFQLVMMGTVNALQSVSTRASIIVNMSFPRILVPASAVVTEAVAFSASLVMLPLMMAVYGVEPTPAALWLPVAIALTALLAASLAYPAALFGLWYPELIPFAVSLVRTLFFLAPGLIALSQITGVARELLPFNPLTGLFELYRDALLYGTSPPAWEILYPLGAGVAGLALGVSLYRREQPWLTKLVG
jgi:ABC-type polysaccharide/polyol phosphate export permease